MPPHFAACAVFVQLLHGSRTGLPLCREAVPGCGEDHQETTVLDLAWATIIRAVVTQHRADDDSTRSWQTSGSY